MLEGLLFMGVIIAGAIIWGIAEEKKQRDYNSVVRTKVLSVTRRDYSGYMHDGCYYQTTFMLYYSDGHHRAVTVRNDSDMYDQYMSKLKI